MSASPRYAVQQVQLVPVPSQRNGTSNAFTGSSTEWALVLQLEREEADRLLRSERRRFKHIRRRRIFNMLYHVLCIAELVFFLVGLYIDGWQVADLNDNVLLGYTASGLTRMGGMNTARIIDRNQYWRIVTALFLPAGAIQMTAALTMVWIFGQLLIRTLHPATIVTIFLTSGLAGSIFSSNVGTHNVTSAVSIPAFGLAGAAISMLAFHWRRYTNHLLTCAVVALVLAVNFFIGATPFVDNSGNTAGLLFGAVAVFCPMLVKHTSTQSPKRELTTYVLAWLSAAVVVTAAILGLIGLQLDAPIGGCCEPWVCTPSPLWDCDASRIWPTMCTFKSFANGTGLVICPQGGQTLLPDLDLTTPAETLTQWCATYCSGLTPGAGSSDGRS